MSEAQKRLEEKHGTPEEFEAAVWRAYEALMVTFDEAIAGIQKYRQEWHEAGTVPLTAAEPAG